MYYGPYNITEVDNTTDIIYLKQGFVTVSLNGSISLISGVMNLVNIGREYVYKKPPIPTSALPTDIDKKWSVISTRTVGSNGMNVSSFFLASDCWFCCVCNAHEYDFDIYINQEVRYIPWRQA